MQTQAHVQATEDLGFWSSVLWDFFLSIFFFYNLEVSSQLVLNKPGLLLCSHWKQKPSKNE